MVGNLKKWKEGTLKRAFEIKGHRLTLTATMNRSKMQEQAGGTNHWINFEWDNTNVSFAEILEAVGELPIPPYLNRATEESDKKTYQTVYSKIKGSVAAPTAGLHFTDRVLKALDEHGIDREELTLFVVRPWRNCWLMIAVRLLWVQRVSEHWKASITWVSNLC